MLFFCFDASASRGGTSILNASSSISSFGDANLNLSNNEFVITPIELKPMRAPAMDGVSTVPVTGSNTPAAIGIPTCERNKRK